MVFDLRAQMSPECFEILLQKYSQEKKVTYEIHYSSKDFESIYFIAPSLWNM